MSNIPSPPQYSFICYSCRESFNIHFKYILSKQNIECPCCGQKLDDEIFENLKQAVNSLNSALCKMKDTYYKNPFDNIGFLVSVTWEEKMPNEYYSDGFAK